MAQKKKWTTVNIDEFFLEQGVVQYGPPAPAGLTNDKPNIIRKAPESKVKIPGPGPMNAPGKKTSTQARRQSKVLNSLSQLGSSPIPNNEPIEPVTVQYAQREDRLFLTNKLQDRLAEARAANDRTEELRLLRLIRNKEELRKARRRPYNSRGVVEELRRKIQQDIEADPQRPLARVSIDRTLDLEVNINYPGVKPGSATMPDENTVNRIFDARTSKRLRDISVKAPVTTHASAVTGLPLDTREQTWLEQLFNINRKKFSRMKVAQPFTIQAAEEELKVARSTVGYQRGAKTVYQAMVSAQLQQLEEELRFLDDSPRVPRSGLPAEVGGTDNVYQRRVKEIYERQRYLKSQLRSRTTMMDINPIYAKHMELIRQAESLGVDVSDLGIKSRTRKYGTNI